MLPLDPLKVHLNQGLKEMIYILCKKENRENIMGTIMEKAGTDTEAHAVAFSIPVDKIAGLRSVTVD